MVFLSLESSWYRNKHAEFLLSSQGFLTGIDLRFAFMSLEITVFLERAKNVLTLSPNIPFECFMREKLNVNCSFYFYISFFNFVTNEKLFSIFEKSHDITFLDHRGLSHKD